MTVCGLNALAPLETEALETINCRATIKNVLLSPFDLTKWTDTVKYKDMGDRCIWHVAHITNYNIVQWGPVMTSVMWWMTSCAFLMNTCFQWCRVTDLLSSVCVCYCDAGRHPAVAVRRQPQSGRDVLSGLHPRLWRTSALRQHISGGWGGKSPSNSQSQKAEKRVKPRVTHHHVWTHKEQWGRDTVFQSTWPIPHWTHTVRQLRCWML